MKNNWIPGLDGIRAISVLIVFISHIGLGHVVPGGFGVTVFFFLSGFLITTLLLQEIQNNGKINYKYFVLRRFFRLFPPLAACLIVSYALVIWGNLGGGISVEGVAAQVFYLANYHSVLGWPGETADGLSILWSLAVEEHFYIFYPLILGGLLISKRKQNVAVFLGVVCILVLAWRACLFFGFEATEHRIYYATDTRIDSILFGCLMALSKNPVFEGPKDTLSFKDISILFLAGAGLLMSFLVRDESFRQTIRYSLQGIAIMPFMYYSVSRSSCVLFSWLNYRPIQIVGIYSYGIYLIHFVSIHWLKQNGFGESFIQLAILSIIASLIFAFVVDRYIDKYFRRLRKKYHS